MDTKLTDSKVTPDSAGWLVVVGSSVGVGLGSIIIVNSSFPILSRAAMGQFGSTQVEIVRAVSLFLACQTIMWPVSGALLDRFGTRVIALGSIALFGITLGLVPFAHTLNMYCAAFAVMGLVSAPTNLVSYARPISTWFDEKRGLALGITASAQGVGVALIPPVSNWAMAKWGWHGAIWLFAAIEIVIAIPVVALLVRDRPRSMQSTAANSVSKPGADAVIRTDDGFSMTQVSRSWTFWALMLCFAMTGLTMYGLMLNIAAVAATLASMDMAHVAAIQMLFGFSAIPGRIISGFLMDRISGYLVAVLITVLTILALVVFATFGSFLSFAIAGLLLGFCSGSEANFMPFFAGKFFGLRSVSKVFGWFLFAFFVGATIGPMAFAKAGSVFGSYVPSLWSLAAIQVVIAGLFLSICGVRSYDSSNNTS